MTRVAHLSDLHFGRHDPRVVEGLLRDLEDQRPDLVAVSGDLTQRAREREFDAGASFLRRLPCPWLAVPGNHDIPLFDVIRRLRSGGVSVVFVSHRLDELYEVCDRVTIMRDGRTVGDRAMSEITKYELVSKNDLGEDVRASPAISRGQIYIRTLQHLYCIGK